MLRVGVQEFPMHEDAQYLRERADTDHDGQLTLAEYIAHAAGVWVAVNRPRRTRRGGRICTITRHSFHWPAAGSARLVVCAQAATRVYNNDIMSCCRRVSS